MPVTIGWILFDSKYGVGGVGGERETEKERNRRKVGGTERQ